jgi:hypothetical protein
MQTTDDTQPDPGGGMPLMMAADLQDHLMMASNDLERLQRLLDHASETLSGHFYSATDNINHVLRVEASQSGMDDGALYNAMQDMASALTALQFHDMATQLIAHTHHRLRSCADRIASEAMEDDEDGAAVVEACPIRPNPVTQDEMDAGSIELF